jgi:hypothetical protein
MAAITYPSEIAVAHFLEHGPESKIELLDHRLVVGHGNGGDLDGLQMKYDVLYPGGVPYGTAILRVLTKSP